MNIRAAVKEAITSEPPEPDVALKGYVRNFLVLRLFIGALGVALPFLLVFIGHGLDGDPWVRNSLSIYYYSGVGAIFVGVLTTIGFFLIAYRLIDVNLENALSIAAGVCVLAVVLFPTGRPNKATDLRPVQDWLGESVVGKIHLTAAALFVVFIGLISLIFGARERDRHRKTPEDGRLWWGHLVCTGFIWLGGLWILATRDFLFGGPRWSVFAGEFVAFLAFGVSWLAKGAERKLLFGWEAPNVAPASADDPPPVV
jgi:hypothetical protein